MKTKLDILREIVEEERGYKALKDKYGKFYIFDDFDKWHDHWMFKRLSEIGDSEWLFGWIYTFIYDEKREDDGWLIPIINEIRLDEMVTSEEPDKVIDRFEAAVDCDPVTHKQWLD